MNHDRYLTPWHWQNAPGAVALLLGVGRYGDPKWVSAFDPGPRGLSHWVPRAMNVRDTVLSRLTADVLSAEYRCQEQHWA